MTSGWYPQRLDLSFSNIFLGKMFNLFSNQLPSGWLFISYFLSPKDNSAWVAIFAKLHISLGIACLFLNGLSLG